MTLRYCEVVIEGDETTLHPIQRREIAHPDVERRAILFTRLLEDGTAVNISRLQGDRAVIEQLHEEADEILRYAVSESRDHYTVYSHLDLNEERRELLRVARDNLLAIDYPVESRADHALEASIIAEDQMIQQAADELPEAYSLTIEKLASYGPAHGGDGDMTDRQREILAAAVEHGYYDNPRQVTYEELAAELGISPGTLGEHLRRIEAKVMPAALTDAFE